MKGVDFATDSVLRWQKSQQIESIKSSSNSALKIAIIAGLIGVPCAIYCFTPFSDQPDYLLWWLLFIVGMPALGIALERGIKSYTKRREADELDNMTVFEFRRSSYRVGSPFVGVVQNPNEDVKPKISERKECSRSEEQEFEVEERKNNVELPSEQKPDNIAVEKKEMIKCSVCGEEVEKGTHICPYCNEPLIEIHYVPCPICGEMIPSNSEFCPECDEYVELNKNE